MYNDGLNRSVFPTAGSRHGVGRGTNAGTFCSHRVYASGNIALIFMRSFLIVGPYTSAKNAMTISNKDQCAAIAKPAAMRKLPKYRGFRVCAYGPVVASRSFLTMCPAAHARIASPTSANDPPTASVSGDGRGPNTR